MAACKKILVLIVSLMALVFAAHSDSGTATYYTQSGPPSACFGNGTVPTFYAAASPAIWGRNGACGRRYRITCTGATNPSTANPCTGASVEVQIIDFCMGCDATFDLFRDAFAIIADLNTRTISIEYQQI